MHKFIFYGGSTICLVLALLVARADSSNTRAVLPQDPAQTLSQSGTLSVQMESGSSIGKGLAYMLLGTGVVLALGTLIPDGFFKPTAAEPSAVRRATKEDLMRLLAQAEQEVLKDRTLQNELRLKSLNDFRRQLRLPIVDYSTLLVPVPTVSAAAPAPSAETGQKKPAAKKPAQPPAPAPRVIHPEHQWILQVETAPCVRITGPMGSGKTSKLSYLCAKGIERGERVVVVNPLAKASQYKGLEVYGRGMNYGRDEGNGRKYEDSAEAGLLMFVEEARRRLERRGFDDTYDPLRDEPHWKLACDEMTDWEDHISFQARKLFYSACTQLLRQANMSVVCISHGETNAVNGGDAVRGKKDILNKQFIRILTEAEADASVLGGLRCAGTATLCLPNKPDTPVKIPTWMQGPRNDDFRPLIAAVAAKAKPGAKPPEPTTQKLKPEPTPSQSPAVAETPAPATVLTNLDQAVPEFNVMQPGDSDRVVLLRPRSNGA